MPKVTGHSFSLVAAGKSILFLEKGNMFYREVVEEEEK
jgi:hypothetical protein